MTIWIDLGRSGQKFIIQAPPHPAAEPAVPAVSGSPLSFGIPCPHSQLSVSGSGSPAVGSPVADPEPVSGGDPGLGPCHAVHPG